MKILTLECGSLRIGTISISLVRVFKDSKLTRDKTLISKSYNQLCRLVQIKVMELIEMAISLSQELIGILKEWLRNLVNLQGQMRSIKSYTLRASSIRRKKI
jgi:hypothetical protein